MRKPSKPKDKLTMEITQERKTQIEEIISGMECPKDFKCYKSGFEDLAKIRIFRDDDLVECLEERSQLCKFSFDFGLGYFCRCPLRIYIAKNFYR
jgi:hypothetical protein